MKLIFIDFIGSNRLRAIPIITVRGVKNFKVDNSEGVFMQFNRVNSAGVEFDDIVVELDSLEECRNVISGMDRLLSDTNANPFIFRAKEVAR